jgi:hypothetical protein
MKAHEETRGELESGIPVLRAGTDCFVQNLPSAREIMRLITVPVKDISIPSADRAKRAITTNVRVGEFGTNDHVASYGGFVFQGIKSVPGDLTFFDSDVQSIYSFPTIGPDAMILVQVPIASTYPLFTTKCSVPIVAWASSSGGRSASASRRCHLPSIATRGVRCGSARARTGGQ